MTEQSLREYADIKQELKQLERLRASMQREAAADIARGLRSKREPSPYASIVDYYGQLIERRRAELQETEAAVDAVPDPTARELLRLRYLEGMTWDAISLAMSYSYTNIHRLHRKALALL